MNTSAEVEIEQKVEVSFNINSITCEGCGVELNFDVHVDGYGDLQITVETHTCED